VFFLVQISDILYFFKDGSGRILIGSEETKFRHLYLITPNYKDGTNTVKTITSGEWQIDEKAFEVDEVRHTA